jgi:hypothetical protein
MQTAPLPRLHRLTELLQALQHLLLSILFSLEELAEAITLERTLPVAEVRVGIELQQDYQLQAELHTQLLSEEAEAVEVMEPTRLLTASLHLAEAAVESGTRQAAMEIIQV